MRRLRGSEHKWGMQLLFVLLLQGMGGRGRTFDGGLHDWTLLHWSGLTIGLVQDRSVNSSVTFSEKSWKGDLENDRTAMVSIMLSDGGADTGGVRPATVQMSCKI